MCIITVSQLLPRKYVNICARKISNVQFKIVQILLFEQFKIVQISLFEQFKIVQIIQTDNLIFQILQIYYVYENKNKNLNEKIVVQLIIFLYFSYYQQSHQQCRCIYLVSIKLLQKKVACYQNQQQNYIGNIVVYIFFCHNKYNVLKCVCTKTCNSCKINNTFIQQYYCFYQYIVSMIMIQQTKIYTQKNITLLTKIKIDYCCVLISII
eukprot:TRINITY_DN15605_c0_g2_i4.p2 TRINITY_DN15605_c0_g2~~TRINITY_DN15605_c0_g2_i4.p2  ORF type:complete len:209 (+),score=-29.20 TRINITY_DN15605_c0_g2_i4:374-1000(+)